MLTRDDLSAIKKVVKEEFQGAEERLTVRINGVEDEVKGVEERLGKEIKGVKVELRAEMRNMEARLEEKIDKVQETVEIVQNVLVKHHDKLEQRVTNIEEELRNPGN